MTPERRPQSQVFGEDPDLYARHRDGYAPLIHAVLAALTPGRAAIEIGPGTGLATTDLLAAGFRVTALEPSAPMAAALRAGVADRYLVVHEHRFEDHRAEPASVDLVAAFQSWHWVDPAAGWPHAARLLRPGGVLGLCWHHPDPVEPGLRARLDSHYARLAPGLTAREPGAKGRDVDAPDGPARAVARRWFDPPVVVEIPGRRILDAEAYVGLLATQSDHRLLAADRRAGLLAALADTVRSNDDPDAGPGRVTLGTTTRLVALRRSFAPPPA